jgi:hypothetical protein
MRGERLTICFGYATAGSYLWFNAQGFNIS